MDEHLRDQLSEIVGNDQASAAWTDMAGHIAAAYRTLAAESGVTAEMALDGAIEMFRIIHTNLTLAQHDCGG